MSHTNYCSSSEKGVKEHHKKISTKTSVSCVEKSPPDPDGNVSFSSSGVKELEGPSLRRKRRGRSSSGVTKQSSLDSYMRTASSQKSASPLLSEPKTAATEPRKSLDNRRKSQIRSSLSSMETMLSRIPQSTKEIKMNTDSGDCDRTRLPKIACSPKSSDLKVRKQKQADMSGSHGCFDARNNNDDDSVFEDYFTSANDVPKRKVLVVHSTSETERLPSFDLEPLNKTRRKSHSQENCSRNRKSKTLNDRGVMEASCPPEEEMLAACMGASLPGPKESKCEKPDQEHMAKKQRRRTKQNLVTLTESKDDWEMSKHS